MSFEQLDELTKKLREYPNLKSYQNAEGFFDSELFPQPEDLEKLINELSYHMAELFINSQGQHSAAYYAAKKAGYRLRVTHRDSFGPLCVLYTEENNAFMVGYG